MALIELPHTEGCLVCGRTNPQGLHLHLHVDPASGEVHVPFTPAAAQMGFEGIIHGGVLATVLDEAMVWAASWPGRRFCVCGELTVRFRHSAAVGMALSVVAKVSAVRSRLIETTAELRDSLGKLIASAGGKYVPMPPPLNEQMVRAMINEPATRQAYEYLAGG
jgi:uncharacterized protein (TIGR00369 family)